jgi:hypothetical protein
MYGKMNELNYSKKFARRKKEGKKGRKNEEEKKSDIVCE